MIRSIIRSVCDRLRNFARRNDKESAEDSLPSVQKNEAEGKTETGQGTGGPNPNGSGEVIEFRRRTRPRGRRRKRRPGTGERPSPSPRNGDASTSLQTCRCDGSVWDSAEFVVPPCEGQLRFHDLDLPDEIMHAIADLGFRYCTPVQAAILPETLSGRDAAGRAQTGTGKTAVFLISALTHFLRNGNGREKRPGTPATLVLAPTRELALQIEKDARALGKYVPCKIVSVFGGMDYEKQRRALSEGAVDVVIGTPGRLLDFMRQGELRLDRVEILVIDEADRMLDMGFIPDVRRIIGSTPSKAKRTTMLFSATLTPQVMNLASQWMRDPVVVEIDPENVTVETIDQVVYITTIEEKFNVLYNMITLRNLERVIVFCNRRDETRRLSERLKAHGISCALLSGAVEQKKRVRTLEDFRAGRIRVLVATDVAARGLHIEGVSHVINYNLPLNAEDYVHRIGRTGRAGASGTSVCFASEDDSFQIPGIEELIGHKLTCVYPDDEWLKEPPEPEVPVREPRQRSTFHSRIRRGRAGNRRFDH